MEERLERGWPLLLHHMQVFRRRPLNLKPSATVLTAYLPITQREHRVDFGCAARRDIAGKGCRASQNERYNSEGQWIVGVDAEQQARKGPCECQRGDDSERQSDSREPETLTNDEP
jgi:hypothetical protein